MQTSIVFNTLASVLGCSLISLLACITISYFPQTLRRFGPLVLSFGAGAMLGDVFFHILPHTLAGRSEDAVFTCGAMILMGVVVSYLIESIIEIIQTYGESRVNSESKNVFWMHIKPIAVTNLLCDLVHNAVDGVSIALAFMVSPQIGLSTTLAILAHETAQELGDFVILVHAGMSFKQATIANVLVSFSSLFSAGLTLYFGSGISKGAQDAFISFAAGAFLYMALVDILPEAMGSHSHGSLVSGNKAEKPEDNVTDNLSCSSVNECESASSSIEKKSQKASSTTNRQGTSSKVSKETDAPPIHQPVCCDQDTETSHLSAISPTFFPHKDSHQHSAGLLQLNIKKRCFGMLGLITGLGATLLVGFLEEHDHDHGAHGLDHHHHHHHHHDHEHIEKVVSLTELNENSNLETVKDSDHHHQHEEHDHHHDHDDHHHDHEH